MSRYRRPRRPGATLFMTVALATRGSDLLLREIEALRQAARLTLMQRPFGIDAWVILPDHMHCLWTLPEGDSDYATRIGAIKARFSRDLRMSGFTPTLADNPYGARAGHERAGTTRRVGVNPDLHKDEAPIWQKRFWEHHIRDEGDFTAHLRYCWLNPVKHGLVSHPKDWPYSSWHRDGNEALL